VHIDYELWEILDHKPGLGMRSRMKFVDGEEFWLEAMRNHVAEVDNGKKIFVSWTAGH
jgi:uncharacterized protein YndB with AHSA1/START domain